MYPAPINIGDRVNIDSRADNLPWIRVRVGHGYLHMLHQGTVIGFTAAKDKAAIQFDEPVFTLRKDNGQRSSFDTGCHGKGPIGYCLYIPVDFLHKASHKFKENVHFHHNTPEDMLLIT